MTVSSMEVVLVEGLIDGQRKEGARGILRKPDATMGAVSLPPTVPHHNRITHCLCLVSETAVSDEVLLHDSCLVS